MKHPSVFELDGFIRQGATSAAFEHHVSTCDACADQLSRLARRASPVELIRDEPEARRFQAAAVALAACLAVLLVRTVSVLPMPVDFRAPEGVHGVGSVSQEVSLVDPGPSDSGVR